MHPMKSNSAHPAPARPTEAEIRAFAHEIYIRSGWLPGRDLENWLEAEAILTAERQLQAHHAPRVLPAHTAAHPHAPAHSAARHPHHALAHA